MLEVSARSRKSGPSRNGRMVSGQMIRASKKYAPLPPWGWHRRWLGKIRKTRHSLRKLSHQVTRICIGACAFFAVRTIMVVELDQSSLMGCRREPANVVEAKLIL